MIKLNGVPIQFGNFPNMESFLSLNQFGSHDLFKDSDGPYNLTLIFENNDDLLHLYFLVDLLESMGVHNNELYITYLPYSRMDRPNGVYSVTVNAIIKLIDMMGFSKVTIREPHSSRSLEIKNSQADDWCANRALAVMNLHNYDSLFFPDFGATLRWEGHTIFEQLLEAGYPYGWGGKKRDFLTGQLIEGCEIKRGTVGEKVLIIDDICSRGGTFINVAKALKLPKENIGLLVSYCESNVFTGQLFDYVGMIFMPEDCIIDSHPQITKIS